MGFISCVAVIAVWLSIYIVVDHTPHSFCITLVPKITPIPSPLYTAWRCCEPSWYCTLVFSLLFLYRITATPIFPSIHTWAVHEDFDVGVVVLYVFNCFVNAAGYVYLDVWFPVCFESCNFDGFHLCRLDVVFMHEIMEGCQVSFYQFVCSIFDGFVQWVQFG